MNEWIKMRMKFDRIFHELLQINFPLTLWLVIAFESEMENVSTIESNRTSFFGCWAFFERGQSEHMAESVGVVGGIFDEYFYFTIISFFSFHPSRASCSDHVFTTSFTHQLFESRFFFFFYTIV